MKTTKNIIYAAFALFAFACLGVPPTLQAVNPPAPDGGYANQNTAEGTNALFNVTSGVWNVAVGFEALHQDTIGNQNTATGYRALFRNISGDKSTAYGSQALFSNTTGTENVAIGFSALSSNVVGIGNTGVGYRTLAFNDASANTAIGWNALFNNRFGSQNTAVGSGALLNGSIVIDNTAVGFQALVNNVGDNNTAVGADALSGVLPRVRTSSDNTAVGAAALFSSQGNRNTALGMAAGLNITSGHDNIDIGNFGVPGDSGIIRIGTQLDSTGFTGIGQYKTFIAGIRGETTQMANAIPVVIDSDGQLGTVSSSRRYKTDIKAMEKASESILALKPVSFRYKVHKDSTPQFGLIAEEVAQVNPDLVIYDADRKPFTVRYDAVNAMLLNEFLKEHKAFVEEQCKVQAQGATIAELKSALAHQQKDFQATAAHQQKQIEALTAGLQKVSAQLELSKSAPRTVLNRQ